MLIVILLAKNESEKYDTPWLWQERTCLLTFLTFNKHKIESESDHDYMKVKV